MLTYRALRPSVRMSYHRGKAMPDRHLGLHYLGLAFAGLVISGGVAFAQNNIAQPQEFGHSGRFLTGRPTTFSNPQSRAMREASGSFAPAAAQNGGSGERRVPFADYDKATAGMNGFQGKPLTNLRTRPVQSRTETPLRFTTIEDVQRAADRIFGVYTMGWQRTRKEAWIARQIEIAQGRRYQIEVDGLR